MLMPRKSRLLLSQSCKWGRFHPTVNALTLTFFFNPFLRTFGSAQMRGYHIEIEEIRREREREKERIEESVTQT
jgi:hypothetical protein